MNRRGFVSGLGAMSVARAIAQLSFKPRPAVLVASAAQAQAAGKSDAGASAAQATGPALIPDVATLIGVGGFRLENLPYLRRGFETHQFCSYDRAGDNYDHEYFPLYTEADGACVLFDAMGPGCLYRHHMNIWHDHEIYKGINIRYFFDDEATPRVDIDISAFFSEENPLGIFKPPLAFNGKERFRIVYHPMFFKRRLKVSLSAEPGGPGTTPMPWAGRFSDLPNRRSHWYNYTYQLFAQDPGLESWTPETATLLMPELLTALQPRESVPKVANSAASSTAVTSADAARSAPVASDATSTPAAASPEKPPATKVAAGQTTTLWQLAGQAGAITSLRIALDPPASESTLFDSWLRIIFDGAESPQIEAPVGCFFGAYRTDLAASYAALPLGFANGEGFCRFAMPFWKSATIEVVNRGSHDVHVTAAVDCATGAEMIYPEETCGHFHARYHREDPRTEGHDYTYLETPGAGQVVGHVVSRWNTSMEEDERTYFDSSRTPWIIGEGFEDDHDMGWGLQDIVQPLFGAMSANGGTGAIYRFLLPDLYCFSSHIKFGHQTYGPHSPLGHEGMYQAGAEESVAFWYGVPDPRIIATDEIDISNAEAENAHAYSAEGDVKRARGSYWYDGEFNDVLFKTPPIEDQGVSFTGSSTFTVAVSPANRGVRLRRRSDKENNRQRARVFVDGVPVRERPWYSVDYEKTYRDIRWFDADFEIPETYTKGKSKIVVRVEFVSSKTGRWDEYHYWVFSNV